MIPLSDISEVVVDLFTLEEIPLHTLEKRISIEGNDPDTLKWEVELTEMEKFEGVRLRQGVSFLCYFPKDIYVLLNCHI